MMRTTTRRSFLQLGSVAILGAPVRLRPDIAHATARLKPETTNSNTTYAPTADANPLGVKALTFDTFGTVVDYRSTIIAEGEALGKAKGFKVDWARFADAWRAGYAPAMNRVRTGELPWTKLDTLHRPDKETYLTAAQLLDLKPGEIMMVAAHQNDLAAAHNLGFKTAFVPRPKEGPNGEKNQTPDSGWDLVAADFNALAGKLGA
jgi:FMN phosphatase YigB (HAD superfamily)